MLNTVLRLTPRFLATSVALPLNGSGSTYRLAHPRTSLTARGPPLLRPPSLFRGAWYLLGTVTQWRAIATRLGPKSTVRERFVA